MFRGPVESAAGWAGATACACACAGAGVACAALACGGRRPGAAAIAEASIVFFIHDGRLLTSRGPMTGAAPPAP